MFTADRPKSHELTTLRKDDGTKLSVTNWITSHEQWRCVDFANMLLRDDVLVRRYQNDGSMGKDEFVRTVLRDWLSRDDSDQLNDTAVPRTWAALAECVTDAGLYGALAKAIRDTCTLSSDPARQGECMVSSHMYRVTSPSYSSWPRPLHTTPPHHLQALSEGPVQSRVSWLLKATVHCQPSRADCQSGPGPEEKE